MLGPDILDWSVNGRASRRAGMPASNRSDHPMMAPHGIYPAAGIDEWVAIACRNDAEWIAFTTVLAAEASGAIRVGESHEWLGDSRWSTVEGRHANHDELDGFVSHWTSTRNKFEIQRMLLAACVPSAAVQRPFERIDHDPSTEAWGLWPEVTHAAIGRLRVDGLPIHLSETDWVITDGAPKLGEHNHKVLSEILGLDAVEIAQLEANGVI